MLKNRFLKNTSILRPFKSFPAFLQIQRNAQTQEVEIPFSNGRNLKVVVGKYARLTDGCAVGTLGDTSVMVTAVSKTKPTPGNFVPLVVDYRQKSAATGRIPTNFLRRELGPTEKEILTSRLIDRSIRPLFDAKYNYETQLVCNMLAMDGINDPAVVSINAASVALSLSDIPWSGPVGAVRVGYVDNEIVVNPTRKELQVSNLNLVVSAMKRNLVVMLEGSADNILQQDLLKAIKTATKEAQNVINSIENLQKTHGKPKREVPESVDLSIEVNEALRSLTEMRVREIFKNYSHDKLSRDEALSLVRTDVVEKLQKNFPDIDGNVLIDSYNKVVKYIFRELIFEEEKRCDGRSFEDLRNISCEVNLYKPLHGSSLFQRGQTQVYCTVTLDSHQSALKLDPVAMLTRYSSMISRKRIFFCTMNFLHLLRRKRVELDQ